MSKVSQWNAPDDPVEYMAWVKEFHKKWLNGSDIDTLKNIVITSDGLGTKAQTQALDILIDRIRDEERGSRMKTVECDCDKFEPHVDDATYERITKLMAEGKLPKTPNNCSNWLCNNGKCPLDKPLQD